ncbi:type II toxin-antitoxin system ParD family antitoxin [Azospirillum doebereinerae]|uniref:Type II toxin-antitoxin system ParD family antitoxin n=1 Tax=Azospirillum doebereinerae TaxID=92933 RepID=A0A3S0UXQ5_9PROT|nr:type II toxin-antitoxin system ParD family antitoxin [Azospirillum doebereinerae]RUQ60897.1 type II toxin-antitoxin system ParD family antitoxin [Azospirillum doebereinerae]
MPRRKNVSVSLSPELQAVAERLLASGRYDTFSEVVRAGLRLLEEREIGFQDQRAARGSTSEVQ